jgi:hypothetical protein
MSRIKAEDFKVFDNAKTPRWKSLEADYLVLDVRGVDTIRIVKRVKDGNIFNKGEK